MPVSVNYRLLLRRNVQKVRPVLEQVLTGRITVTRAHGISRESAFPLRW